MRSFFKKTCQNLVGMIHLRALPGTPLNNLSLTKIIDKALEEAELLKKFDYDAMIVENMHDVPYVKSTEVGPEVVASMTRACCELRKIVEDKPIGIQILAGANEAAMAVAQAADLDFIRAEGFVYGHVADEGWLEACAGRLLRYRKLIGAENISVLADIKVSGDEID